VNQLYVEQSPYGNWGPLSDKDYSCKSIFPTTFVAIDRCLYIGLTLEDKDILFMALEYLEEFLEGTSRVKLYNRNERAIPWQLCQIAAYAERIRPNNPLCDELWKQWYYIASRAFADGEYSYEYDMQAQHDILFTKEKRLVPMPLGLLLARHKDINPDIEKDMLNYYGKQAYHNGYFWDKSLDQLPDEFVSNKTRRWFPTINYINRFHNTEKYLKRTMEWLIENKNPEGFWNYGPQVKDPWGYFEYFSTNRNYKYNNIVNCTMEVLSILKTYLDHNELL
jgi:hypothetical protein